MSLVVFLKSQFLVHYYFLNTSMILVTAMKFGQVSFAGHRSQVTGRRLQVAGRRLQVTGRPWIMPVFSHGGNLEISQ